MAKKLIIDYCSECCHFDNQYWGYREWCELLHRRIEATVIEHAMPYIIPKDCPLEDV